MIIGTLPEMHGDPSRGRGAGGDEGRRRFESAGIRSRVIGVSPGAAYGTAKRWLPERFAEAAAELAVRRMPPSRYSGRRMSVPCARTVAAQIRAQSIEVHNYAGSTTLGEFIDLPRPAPST